MNELGSEVPMALLQVDYLLALPVLWCVFAGVLAVVTRRRGGIPGPPTPHRLAIPVRDPRDGSELAYDVEATERRIRSLEDRLDFAESLMYGRPSAERDPGGGTSGPRADNAVAFAGSDSRVET